MVSLIELGNRYAQYARTRDLTGQSDDMHCVASLPLDPSEFEVLGFPDMAAVYPVEESEVCLNFFKGGLGVEAALSIAYIRLPYGEHQPFDGDAELSGYVVNAENGQPIALTDTQKSVALQALKNALENSPTQ